jgi:hypothetical protein
MGLKSSWETDDLTLYFHNASGGWLRSLTFSFDKNGRLMTWHSILLPTSAPAPIWRTAASGCINTTFSVRL